MASTYSSLLKIELIGSGEQSNSWGNTTNNNLSQSVEFAIAGVYSKNLSSSANPYVLTTANGPQSQADNEARNAAIVFSAQSANHTVQFNATQKIYFLRNANTTYTITCRLGSSGNTHVINPSTSVFLATDGTNWFELQTSGGTWQTKTGTYTALSGDQLFVNTTSSAFTITFASFSYCRRRSTVFRFS